jgi:hypothetical protein
MRQKLTARLVETLPIPKARRAEYHDELLPGLRLRVFITGRKSWSVVGRVDGRQIRLRAALADCASEAAG